MDKIEKERYQELVKQLYEDPEFFDAALKKVAEIEGYTKKRVITTVEWLLFLVFLLCIVLLILFNGS